MMSSADLRPRLMRFLLDTGRVTEPNLDASLPLITSGLIDSVTLFDLAMWIEEEVGRSVDLTRIALPGDWDTVNLIVTFIERERSG